MGMHRDYRKILVLLGEEINKSFIVDLKSTASFDDLQEIVSCDDGGETLNRMLHIAKTMVEVPQSYLPFAERISDCVVGRGFCREPLA
ncbi:MAG: hypothetical protein ACI9CF_000384 [Candidatus Omnitrophota bacterium]|jgi:hypothetical protein